MKACLMLLLLGMIVAGAGCATATPAAEPKPTASALLTPVSAPLDAAAKDRIGARLKATFKNFQFDDLRTSQIPGVYEVYSGPRIIYYAPQQDVLIFGEFYSTSGHSLTGDELAQRQSTLAATIDVSAAISVGNGPIEMLAFVDPDCGYCKASHEWLVQQGLTKNITEKVFFMPLTGRPEAHARAESVICAPPALRQAAYDQIWGSPPSSAPLLTCDGADKLLAAQAAEAAKFGIRGTPTFVVKAQTVTGFQRDRLQSLLSVNP